MKRLSNQELRDQFIAWQCRIRQIAVRDYGGRPLIGMRPRVSTRTGELLSPGAIVLLVPKVPREASAFFRHQCLRHDEPKRVLEAGLSYLASDYYQLPELFSDEMTAVFAPGSQLAARLARAREVLLDFQQFSQGFRMFCTARRLGHGNEGREASLWHNRLFNPNLPNDAAVVGLKPDWNTAQAEAPA